MISILCLKESAISSDTKVRTKTSRRPKEMHPRDLHIVTLILPCSQLQNLALEQSVGIYTHEPRLTYQTHNYQPYKGL